MLQRLKRNAQGNKSKGSTGSKSSSSSCCRNDLVTTLEVREGAETAVNVRTDLKNGKNIYQENGEGKERESTQTENGTVMHPRTGIIQTQSLHTTFSIANGSDANNPPCMSTGGNRHVTSGPNSAMLVPNGATLICDVSGIYGMNNSKQNGGLINQHQQQNGIYASNQQQNGIYASNQQQNGIYASQQQQNGIYASHQQQNGIYASHQQQNGIYASHQQQNGIYASHQQQNGIYASNQHPNGINGIYTNNQLNASDTSPSVYTAIPRPPAVGNISSDNSTILSSESGKKNPVFAMPIDTTSSINVQLLLDVQPTPEPEVLYVKAPPPTSGPPAEPPPVSPKPSRRLSPKTRSESSDADSGTWPSLEDSRSEFSFSTGDSPGLDDDLLSADRVAVICDGEIGIMINVSCESEETSRDCEFQEMLSNVCRVCLHYFRRSEQESATLNTTQIGALVMPDRRPISDHVRHAAKRLSDSIVVNRATCRRTGNKGYVGTHVVGSASLRGCCTIGRIGIMVTLRRLNKLAPAREFAEQLCKHIHRFRPKSLGNRAQLAAQFKERRDSARHRPSPAEADQLLAQTFLCDNTIAVWEAAKRSFLEVLDFIIYR